MPRYDMKCQVCDNFEEDLVMSYEEMKAHKCPQCGGDTEYVITDIVINTSASKTFVRVPPERKAEIAFMRAEQKRTREVQKEQRAAVRKRRTQP